MSRVWIELGIPEYWSLSHTWIGLSGVPEAGGQRGHTPSLSSRKSCFSINFSPFTPYFHHLAPCLFFSFGRSYCLCHTDRKQHEPVWNAPWPHNLIVQVWADRKNPYSLLLRVVQLPGTLEKATLLRKYQDTNLCCSKHDFFIHKATYESRRKAIGQTDHVSIIVYPRTLLFFIVECWFLTKRSVELILGKINHSFPINGYFLVTLILPAHLSTLLSKLKNNLFIPPPSPYYAQEMLEI